MSDVHGTAWDISSIGLWDVAAAATIFGEIWVVSFSIDAAVVLDILEGVRWSTTFAPMVIKVTSTINKLLLSKIKRRVINLLRSDLPVSLKSGSSGESPAGTAFALSLNGGYDTSAPPVDWEWVVSVLLSFELGGGLG